MRSLIGLAALGVGATLAGCFLFTGSTEGYSLFDAGLEAGDCPPGDGGVCVSLECTSSSECGGSGTSCCGGLLAPNVVGTTCQASKKCSDVTVQVCQSNSECTGVECIEQQCAASPNTVRFRACGLASQCQKVSSRPADAPDSAPPADSGQRADAEIVDAGIGDSAVADAGSDG